MVSVSSLLWTLAATLLAPYLPLYGSAAPPLGLAAVAIGQLFVIPPAPTGVDWLLLPLSVAASWPRARTTASTWSLSKSAIAVTTGSHWQLMAFVPVAWRPHLASILRTPASRRIFGFLCVNLAYMGVQMAYGVITNSLGLISDGEQRNASTALMSTAIHMLFDCLGLAVGLWASVAATWKPDGQYTFGYARVETLSGFANG